MVWNLFLEPLPGSLLDEVEREEAVFQALDTDVLGARLSAPIGYNLACSIEVASLAVMCPLGPASASNLVKSNVIEWKSADEICTLGADKGYDATAFVREWPEHGVRHRRARTLFHLRPLTFQPNASPTAPTCGRSGTRAEKVPMAGMRRRDFIAAAGSTAVAWQLVARAQQPERMRRIGFISLVPENDWRRLSAGAGTKGPRLHDWCYLELADLEGEESNHHSQVLWTRGLLIRRNIANGDLAYFTTWCPAGTSIKTLVSVEGHRWAIEDSFETAKNEFGLDHNESRSWHGWHRHVSLVMLAFAMMAAIQHHANKPAPKKQSRVQRQDIRSHPLVDPGNPPHSPTSRAKAHPTRRCHRMVALAAGSSGRSTEISCQTKITTVMVELEPRAILAGDDAEPSWLDLKQPLQLVEADTLGHGSWSH